MESMLLHTLDERFPKSDIVTQGNNENKENKIIEPWSHMGKILTHLENMKIESQNHDHSSLQDPSSLGFNSGPRNYLIPNIDMRKFYGKYPITWIFRWSNYFIYIKCQLYKR
jgi:hypothetical protein